MTLDKAELKNRSFFVLALTALGVLIAMPFRRLRHKLVMLRYKLIFLGLSFRRRFRRFLNPEDLTVVVPLAIFPTYETVPAPVYRRRTRSRRHRTIRLSPAILPSKMHTARSTRIKGWHERDKPRH